MVAWRALREPTVPILLAASVVHVVRRDLVDLLLFTGTAGVILIDSQRGDASAAGAARLGRPRAWLVVAGMTVFSAVVALAAPASVGARLVLVAIGLAALAAALARPRQLTEGRDGAPSARGWPVWAVIGVAACLWELTSFIAQQVWPLDQRAHPAVSDLVGPLLQSWLGRTVFLLLWTGAGWWLMRQMVGAAPGAGSGEKRPRIVDMGARGERSEPAERHTWLSDPREGQSEAGR